MRTMPFTLSLLSTLTLVLSCSVVQADGGKKKVEYRKTQEVSFDAQDVDGQVRTPDGSFVNPQKGVRFMPLYKIDKRFDKAIKDSPEFVR
jgi:hypothetical protein